MPPRKLDLWFLLRSFSLLRLLFALQIYNMALDMILFSWLCWCWWICLLGYRGGYAGQLVLQLLPLEPLAYCWNVANLNLFSWYYFGRCSSELVELVSFPYSCWMSSHYSNRVHDFSVTIPTCYRDVYQQFPSLHSQILEFFTRRMLSFDLWSKWL